MSLRVYRNYENNRDSYQCRIRMGRYIRPKPFDTAAFQSDFEAILPLPNELRDDTRAEFNTPSLETVGDIINTPGAVGSGLLATALGVGLRKSGDIISGGLGAVAGGLTQVGTGSESAGDMMQQQTQQILDPASITSAIQQSTGVAPNPNQTVAFQGPALRDHNFTWTFFPNDDVESNNIRALVNELKKRSLPTSTMSDHAGILNYPQMAIINFYPWDGRGSATPPGNIYGWTDQSIIKIKKCFIASVNVNYSPSGQAAFFSGDKRPVAIQLSLSLKEIEYMMGEDYGGSSGYEGISNLFSNIASFGTSISNAALSVGESAIGAITTGQWTPPSTDGTTTNPVAEGEL